MTPPRCATPHPKDATITCELVADHGASHYHYSVAYVLTMWRDRPDLPRPRVAEPAPARDERATVRPGCTQPAEPDNDTGGDPADRSEPRRQRAPAEMVWGSPTGWPTLPPADEDPSPPTVQRGAETTPPVPGHDRSRSGVVQILDAWGSSRD